MIPIKVTTPLDEEQIKKLNCGDKVLITGTIYTARDAAHMNMAAELARGRTLPFPTEGSVIYYAGSSPARPGNASGAFGPTTSGRMDKFTKALLDLGIKGMIGKGKRSKEVIDSMVENGAVYFAAIGGAGALIATAVRSTEVVAYPELGAEAINKIEVVDFPAIVAIDSTGKCIYQDQPI
jgi:fumarate hydratase subunit beta